MVGISLNINRRCVKDTRGDMFKIETVVYHMMIGSCRRCKFVASSHAASTEGNILLLVLHKDNGYSGLLLSYFGILPQWRKIDAMSSGGQVDFTSVLQLLSLKASVVSVEVASM